MYLNIKQREVLKKLSETGFLGNWYKAFGIVRLDIYKANNDVREFISIWINPKVIDIVTHFPGVDFISKEADDLKLSFEPALNVISDVFRVEEIS
jgi:hypothetical protein